MNDTDKLIGQMKNRNRLGVGVFPRLVAVALLIIVASAAKLQAAPLNQSAPDFDRWNYPFNGTNGSRGSAPTFGAVGTSFDDADGQFLIGFNLASQLPTLNPGESFKINSLTVTATHSSGSFLYDPTYDSYQSYLDIADSAFVADSDTGRPIMLTGAATKSTVGYSGFSFNDLGDATNSNPPFYGESETFGFGDPSAKNTRSAFAFDPSSVSGSNPFGNVSNFVSDGFDFTPFAIGTTGLNPGDAVVEASPGSTPGSTFTFDVDVTDAGIQSYLADGLANGGLFFSIISLHDTGMSGGSNPNFYTDDNFDPAAVPATLSLDFEVIPEPGTCGLLAFGLMTLLARRRRQSPTARMSRL